MRKWKRKKLASRPYPEQWLPYLEQHLQFYPALPEDLREKFLQKLKIFIWEKLFTPAGGLEMTDEIRVVVAACAVRLILHLDLSFYDELSEIIIYPHNFSLPEQEVETFGVAHSFGVVVLSWPAVLEGLKNPADGHDTALHEFAHVLDSADGDFDGTPKLHARENYRHWARVMSKHFLRLRDGKRKKRPLLRDYGALNEAEFFAVATEVFFEQAEKMKQQAPDLYQELCRFYGFEEDAP